MCNFFFCLRRNKKQKFLVSVRNETTTECVYLQSRNRGRATETEFFFANPDVSANLLKNIFGVLRDIKHFQP